MRKIFDAFKSIWSNVRFFDLVLVSGGLLLALLLRYMLRNFTSPDLKAYTLWFDEVKSHGFAVFGLLNKEFPYDYSFFYLYLLLILSFIFPHMVSSSAVKLLPVSTDLISAYFVYKLVRLKFKNGPIPYFAAFAFLFAPTIILNSSVWGQTDSIFTAFILASLYLVITKKNGWACAAFGLAFSIKLQAIFFAPFLIALLVRKSISWKQFLLAPGVYLATFIPAWMAGVPFGKFTGIYQTQVERFPYFELSFPNIYYQLPDELFRTFFPATLLLAAAMVLIYISSIHKTRIQLTDSNLILFALVSVVFMPYFLPKMHERYLYLGDALSIVFGFYFPQYFLIPVVVNLFSFSIYERILFSMEGISGYILQIALTLVVVYLGKIMLTTLYPNQKNTHQDEGDPKPAALPANRKKSSSTDMVEKKP